MKLLLTTDAVGGVATYADDLTAALSARGVEVFQAVLGPTAATRSTHRINTGLPLDWTAERPEEVRFASQALAALARELQVDLVQLHAPALAISGEFPVPTVTVVHSCVSTWWSAVRGGALPADLAWRAAQADEGLDRSALVITPTAAFGQAVQAAYDLPHLPVTVHNGRPEGIINPTAQVDAVLTVGRLWDEGKNVAVLDRATPLINAPVHAVGPMQGPNGAGAVLRHCKVVGPVSQQDLRARYAERPVFVSTALYEPFGLAVLEAAQAGCALVLSDIPTLRELWDGAATFVDVHDTVALAGAVNTLLTDKAARKRAGEAAQARARRYNIEKTADAMLTHYRALLNAEKRHAA